MKHRGLLAAVAIVAGVLGAEGAIADPPGAALAAPGPCAEPRIEAREAPPSGFDVGGGPRAHFDPNDVAADAASARAQDFERPRPPDVRRGPCEGPVDCATVGGGITESPPVPGNPPGVTPR